VAGFGESIAELLQASGAASVWLERGVSAAALLVLAFINMAGVKWVVKVQFLLLFLILLAVLDFVVGSFLPSEEGKNRFLTIDKILSKIQISLLTFSLLVLNVW
jgi:potassium/chloride transporter 8